jgi:SAM-dependent methyltransferase
VNERAGFRREELKCRYDVDSIQEDTWHTHSGDRTSRIILDHLGSGERRGLLLNAGAGIYRVEGDAWNEFPLDLFTSPIRTRSRAVCARIEQLPFRSGVFDAVICVGEVLDYCDPARSIPEFARVLKRSGILVCDFGNSRSFTHWLRPAYGRAADLVTTPYNGSPERTWVYDPSYVYTLLETSGFEIKAKIGIHTWSALARRLGASVSTALRLEKIFTWARLPIPCSEVITVVALRATSAT